MTVTALLMTVTALLLTVTAFFMTVTAYSEIYDLFLSTTVLLLGKRKYGGAILTRLVNVRA